MICPLLERTDIEVNIDNNAPGCNSPEDIDTTCPCNAPPVALCKDTTIYLGANGQAALSPDQIDNGSSDDKEIVKKTISKSSFTCENLGENAITLTVEDAQGLQDFCTAKVTVKDTISPIIQNCPKDTTLALGGSCQINLPDFRDKLSVNEADLDTIIQTPSADTILSGSGTSVNVSLIARDKSGNTDTCTFKVTLKDSSAPSITCPQNQTLEIRSLQDLKVPDFRALATNVKDNCDPKPIISQIPAPGDILPKLDSMYTITLIVKDNMETSASCPFKLTLIDKIPPTIQCPPSAMALNLSSQCDTILPDYRKQISISGADTIIQDPPPGTPLSGAGTKETIRITAEANNGTVSSCDFTVTLKDVTPPQIACPSTTQVLELKNNTGVEVPDYSNLVSDACDTKPEFSQTPPFGTLLTNPNQVYQITLKAKDSSGNESQTCQFNISLVDKRPPVVTCPDADTVLNLDENCSAKLLDFRKLIKSDKVLDFEQNPPPGHTLQGHNTIQNVLLTALDGLGGTITCTVQVTLKDTIPPQNILCPTTPQTLKSNQNGQFIVPDYRNLAQFSDNCDTDLLLKQNPDSGTVLTGANTSHTITIEAQDDAGKNNTCSFTLTLIEDIPLIVQCPEDQLFALDKNCQFILPNFSDLLSVNQPDVDISQSPGEGTVLSGVGTVRTITLTATKNGKSSSCTFKVKLSDETSPVITCPTDRRLKLDPADKLRLPDYRKLAVVSDNCDPAPKISQSPSPGTLLSSLGSSQEIKLTAKDKSENTGSCSFKLDLSKLIFDADSGTASTDEIINLPVRVKNFRDVAGYQFQIEFAPEKAEFIEINNIHPTFFGTFGTVSYEVLSDGLIRLAWFDFSSRKLADSTVIFSIRLRIQAQEEGNFPVKITQTLASDVLGQEILSTGLEGIITVINRVSLSGRVLTEDQLQVNKVLFTLSGNGSSIPFTTGVDGKYKFEEVRSGKDYILSPSKEGNPDNGVDVRDLVLINRHYSGITLLNSPYKILAADADLNREVNALDTDKLRDLVIHRINTLPKSWRFVPQAFSFGNPANPFVSPVPETIQWSNLREDKTDIHFVGIKMGDVTYDRDVTKNNAKVLLAYQPKTTQGEVTFIFTAQEGYEQIIGWQGTLKFDPETFIFDRIESSSLAFGAENIAQEYLSRGYIPFLYMHAEGAAETFAPGTTLFSLSFKVKKPLHQTALLELNSDITPLLMYNEKSTQSLEIALHPLEAETNTGEIKIYPNPGAQFILEGIDQLGHTLALKLTDMLGKTQGQWTSSLSSGTSQLELDLRAYPQGTYYLEIKGESGETFRQKIIISK
ncbi:MAG: HYR domain-containing protein [Microscillaceae bacterium]|nr:HYR domain-containing protein [Microscillaceae bacterium]